MTFLERHPELVGNEELVELSERIAHLKRRNPSAAFLFASLIGCPFEEGDVDLQLHKFMIKADNMQTVLEYLLELIREKRDGQPNAVYILIGEGDPRQKNAYLDRIVERTCLPTSFLDPTPMAMSVGEVANFTIEDLWSLYCKYFPGAMGVFEIGEVDDFDEEYQDLMVLNAQQDMIIQTIREAMR